MTRNRAYDLGAALLAVAASIVAGVAIALPALAGCAVLLVIGAGAFALLRVRSRVRSESRHRWTLQRRVGLLEESMRQHADLAEEQRRVVEERVQSAELKSVETPEDEAGYLHLAILHDRIYALEASLRPTS